MSALLTEEMCARAWTVALEAVAAAAQAGVTNKLAGTIVVIDPTAHYAPSLRPGDGVLYACTITFHEKAEVYKKIAHAKAHLSWRTGRSSRDIQQNTPHLFQEPYNRDPGDVKWGGSVVREGLVVAFSGVQPEYDEWIAGMMADLLIAMCRTEMADIMANEDDFIDRNRNGKLAAGMAAT